MTGERERGGGGDVMPSLMATSLRWRTHSARTKTLTYQSKVGQHLALRFPLLKVAYENIR